MKLWSSGTEPDPTIERFTVGRDPVLDRRLVRFDCLASEAHAEALHAAGVLDAEELRVLQEGLHEIVELDRQGGFEIRPEDEDCHTAIEAYLTRRCGEAGEKIHTARSRNDQVLTAIRLYEKVELDEIESRLRAYRAALEGIVDRQGEVVLPGYTHMQRAMPTTVAVWAGAFVAAADDDLPVLRAVAKLVDQSPLGTAAGFGVPVLEIDREAIARRLGFACVQRNPMYAQLSRGRTEASILAACSQILFALNRLATDLVVFATREFGFVDLATSHTTGSSIMPQKKNPDVLELVRAKYHVVVGEEMKVKGIGANLVSGYNRDVQLTKEPLFAGLDATKECLEVLRLVLDGLSFDEAACKAAVSDELFATERAYELVAQGVPFREAYRRIAERYRRPSPTGGHRSDA